MIELGFEFQAMASHCEVRIAGAEESLLRAAAAGAIAEVRRIERKYSRYDAGSIVSSINSHAGSGVAVAVDDETAALIDFAARLHESSAGSFDITSGVLRRAWNFRVPRLPPADEVAAVQRLVGWPRVAWHGRRIALPEAGMEIDFGGFGKEYAADRAAAALLRAGVENGYVNLGGDIRLVGPRADGSAWHISIQHPRLPASSLAVLELSTGALATSGDYERFFEIDGRRYCHVLDPRSGWPVDHWQSVSVVAPTCAAAGALCTIALLMGDAAGPFLDAQGVGWLAVDAQGRLAGNLGCGTG